MPSDHRHATDRVDGTIVAECPNKDHEDDDHLAAVVEYHDASDTDLLEQFAAAFETCRECGAEVDYIRQEEPTEVLE
jgi:hypothetical protein